MRRDFLEERTRAIALFKQGYGPESVSQMLCIPKRAVEKWNLTYRALGEEGLMSREHKTYGLDLKVQAVRAVIEEGMTKPKAMEVYGIKSISQIEDWCRKFKDGGIDALRPKSKGRPRKQPMVYASREEELEARVKELELELEIQKRINALAEELGHE